MGASRPVPEAQSMVRSLRAGGIVDQAGAGACGAGTLFWQPWELGAAA